MTDTIDLNKCFVPNWFEKKHIEGMLGRSLTEAEWYFFLKDNQDSLMNYVTELVEEVVTEYFDEGGE